MSIRINGVEITNPEAYRALSLVATNPQAFGIDPATLHFGRLQESAIDGRPGAFSWELEVNFTTAQVLQILNPHRPGRRSIDWGDLNTRVAQCDGLNSNHFVGLAQEFSRRFPAALRSARTSIHSDILNIRLPQRSDDPNSRQRNLAIEQGAEIYLRVLGIEPNCP